MTDRLQQIVESKRVELARRKRDRPLASLCPADGPRRDLAAALRRTDQGPIGAIAEIKRRSPSKGLIREQVDAADTARDYEAHGARAISVLTDSEYFGGSDEDLIAARRASKLPVLRKDFTVDPYQIHEARHLGADAVLLIVRVVGRDRLAELLELTRALELEALVEIHDEQELRSALECDATIIGVNSRDLATFETDLAVALRLRPLIPADRIAVAESGIATRQDVERLERCDFDAMLVGETLMRAPRPGACLAQLLGEG